VEVTVTQPTPTATARLQVTVAGQPIHAGVRAAVTTALERLLGLRIDLREFYEFAAHDRRLGPLARRFLGMKPPRFASVFEGVISAMACQQMTLTLGIRLLNDLAEAFGTAFNEGDETVYAFPDPAKLAKLSPSDLRRLGFSRQKGQAMIELARSVAEGNLDLEHLADMPDDEAVARLSKLRGVGRWTAEYVLLRGLGRTHVFPGDDVGARNNLARWLHVTTPLDYEGVREILSGWDEYSGLLYFHLLLERLAEAVQFDA
jgi:DNA-3-methyladenine glycosylase II